MEPIGLASFGNSFTWCHGLVCIRDLGSVYEQGDARAWIHPWMDGVLQGKLKVSIKHDGSRFIRQKLSYVRQRGPCHSGSWKNARHFLRRLLVFRWFTSPYQPRMAWHVGRRGCECLQQTHQSLVAMW